MERDWQRASLVVNLRGATPAGLHRLRQVAVHTVLHHRFHLSAFEWLAAHGITLPPHVNPIEGIAESALGALCRHNTPLRCALLSRLIALPNVDVNAGAFEIGGGGGGGGEGALIQLRSVRMPRRHVCAWHTWHVASNAALN
jgi:hypothetical protein